MADIFISYAREDKEFVQRLCDALKKLNRQTWVDWEGIPPSAEWRQEILAAIEGADAIIQVVSPCSAASKICGVELSHAVINNKRIIPIIRADVEENALAEAIKEKNWIFFRESDDFDAGVAGLIAALDTNIEWVRVHTRLLTRANEWERNRRDYSYALRGSDLKNAEAALASGDQFEPRLLPLQIDYILASRRSAHRRVAVMMATGTLAVVAILIFGALFILKREESSLNLAANFREMGISELGSNDPLGAEVLFSRALSIGDNVGARERLIEARAKSPRMIWVHAPETKGSSILAISGDGALFAMATPKELAIWSVLDRQKFRVFQRQPDGQGRLLAAFSSMHRFLAVGRANKADVWDLQSASDRPVKSVTLQSNVSSLSFGSDGHLLVIGEERGVISSWELAKPGESPFRQFFGHSDRITGTAVGGNGQFLVSGSWDETAKVWNLPNGTPAATFTGHDDALLCVANSPDGNAVASAGWDDTIWIWDRKTGKRIRALTGHRGSILALAFSPRGRWLASGSEDHTARLWDAERGRFVLTFPGHSGEVTAVAFFNGNDHQGLVTGDATGVVRVWDLSVVGQRKELTTFEGHGGAVTMVAFDPAAPLVASSSTDKSIALWSLQSHKLTSRFRNEPGSVSAVAFSANSRFIASATKSSIVHVRNVETGEERVFQDDRAKARIRHIAFSPDGQILAGGSEDGRIRIWNVKEGSVIHSFAAHAAKIQGLRFSPDGKLMASSSEDSTIKLWETSEWHLKNTLIGHRSGVYEVAFSPDANLLLSGSDDNTARLWSVASGKEVTRPIEHNGPVWAVDFNPDGKTIATGDEDSVVRFWKLSGSGTSIQLRDHFVLRIADGPIWWLRFHDYAGQVYLGIASQDKKVRVIHMSALATLFSDPERLEIEAEERGGLVVGDGPNGMEIIPMQPKNSTGSSP